MNNYHWILVVDNYLLIIIDGQISIDKIITNFLSLIKLQTNFLLSIIIDR